jgi:hypothetical protein
MDRESELGIFSKSSHEELICYAWILLTAAAIMAAEWPGFPSDGIVWRAALPRPYRSPRSDLLATAWEPDTHSSLWSAFQLAEA